MPSEDSRFIGGRLCLDFANTADWHARPDPEEGLKTYPALVSWSLDAGILSAADADKLVRDATRQPSQAEEVLARALELREAIYQIFASLASGAQAPPKDLAVLNRQLSHTMHHGRLIPKKNGFMWDVTGNKDDLDWMLNVVVHSAAELLTSGELDRVKMCADDRGCGWLFLDTSRNKSRRWCDMKDCGNRAKAKRFYQRKHA